MLRRVNFAINSCISVNYCIIFVAQIRFIEVSCVNIVFKKTEDLGVRRTFRSPVIGFGLEQYKKFYKGIETRRDDLNVLYKHIELCYLYFPCKF